MSYAIVEIEVTLPLPKINLSETDTGIAIIWRNKGKPVGFAMKEIPANTVVKPEQLANITSREIGTKLLEESIREELKVFQDYSHSLNLTVAICTKDRPNNLARCLRSLLKVKESVTEDLDILVIDNAPLDNRTKELVASLSQVRYVREAKPGLNFARNRAIQNSQRDLIAFVDDDVVVDEQWFAGLREAYYENPEAAAFTGLVLPYELETSAQILFERGGGFRRGFEKIHYGKILPGNPLYPCGAGIFGAGCNMAFRREVLLEIGGFDEALDTGKPLPGGGDLDIFYRVIRANYPLVYEPRYLVFHQHRRDWGKLRHQYWTWGLGFMAFVTKSFQSDLPMRSQFLRLIKWWFKYQLENIKQSIKGNNPLPVSMILAETWGGIVGLFGEYSRSLKRVAKIRKYFS